MSLIAMAGGATGTGTVTLLAPVTSTNRTLTLPDATGTLITTSQLGQIQPISASVASNALTINLSNTTLDFRSATLNSGTVSSGLITGVLSLVIPTSATLGTINAVQSRLIVLAINNAGIVELAVVNIAGGNNLDETTLINTTAISASATAANVIYSTTARTSVPFRVVGYVESTQATAGTWATAPSTVQGQGGNALTAMSSLGYGQTWQDVAASRAVSTTYYNTTGKPILVSVCLIGSNSATTISQGFVNGVVVCRNGMTYASSGNASYPTLVWIVPTSSSYSVTSTQTVLSMWSELR